MIATGGGIVLREENRALLKQTGKVIWLEASPEETLERVRSDSGRPLLDSDSEEELALKSRRMIELRTPAYLAAADQRIFTDGKSVESICSDVRPD